jgi:hypothetical protein
VTKKTRIALEQMQEILQTLTHNEKNVFFNEILDTLQREHNNEDLRKDWEADEL